MQLVSGRENWDANKEREFPGKDIEKEEKGKKVRWDTATGKDS